MTAGINPEVLSLARQHGVSIGVALRMRRESLTVVVLEEELADEIDDECSNCDGTGLGMTEETRCGACKGTGQHFNFKHYYDEDMEP